MKFSRLHLFVCIACVLPLGCMEKTVYETNGIDLTPTNTDLIASKVSESWHPPSRISINRGLNGNVSHRTFLHRDGSGLLAILETDGFSGGGSHLFLASFGSGGTVRRPVLIQGDHTSVDFLRTMVAVFTPDGDAAITYLAREDTDPSNTNDLPAMRVYYTYFKRALAGSPTHVDGEEFGFDTTPTKIDTNTTGSDDDDAFGLFAAGSMLDGQHSWGFLANSLKVSGHLNTTGGDTPFLFLGWVHTTPFPNLDDRLEGRFVDLKTLALMGGNIAIATSPGIANGEDIELPMVTSGRDIVFRWTDSDNGSAVSQDRINLVRVNAQGNQFTSPIDVTRGEGTSQSSIGSVAVFGDGNRVLNGQASTWFVFDQAGFEGGSITQRDRDLVIARVNPSGSLEIDEFDHNIEGADKDVSLGGFGLSVARGATRGVVWYRQRRDVSDPADSNLALFARAIRISDDNSLTFNVSEEQQVSANNSSGASNHSDVGQVWQATQDPFCGPQTDNNAYSMAFAQDIAGDSPDDGMALRYAKVTIGNAAGLGKPSLDSSSPLTVFDDQDQTWSVGFTTGGDVRLADSGEDGDAVVFFVAQGNNASNSGNSQAFREPRLFAFAPSLRDGQSLTSLTQVSTDPTTSWPDWSLVNSLVAVVQTPGVPAARDFTWNDDQSLPNFAHAIVNEYFSHTRAHSVFRVRTLDLRSGVGTSAQARFVPALLSQPAMLGTGGDVDLAVGFTSEGDTVLAQYMENEDDQIWNNTFDPGSRAWSAPALLSNDPADPDEGVKSPGVVPGVNAGCRRTLGAWTFWVRLGPNNTNYLQGRRFRGTNLPR